MSLIKMLSNFSKVLMAHIPFIAVINNGGIGGIQKSTFTFCNVQITIGCKAKMLPGYTSLLKKLSHFPNTLTGTIIILFFLLYLPMEASGKAPKTPGKV